MFVDLAVEKQGGEGRILIGFISRSGLSPVLFAAVDGLIEATVWRATNFGASKFGGAEIPLILGIRIWLELKRIKAA